MKGTRIIHGKKSHRGTYALADINELVGKTVEAVGSTRVEGEYGSQPMTVLFFSDKTTHGFVHPSDDEDD